MGIFKDFLGINYAIYDPILDDEGALGGNNIGYDLNGNLSYSDYVNTGNQNISQIVEHSSEMTIVLLNLHRNGPYGYSTWQQIRVSDNPLSRRQKKANLFSYEKKVNSNNQTFFFTEPIVTDSCKPLVLVGEISVYDSENKTYRNKSVEIKTSLDNETSFFTNREINEDYDLILDTAHNYEDLKHLYLDGGLESDRSPLDSFNLLTYNQTVFPKQKNAFLAKTRERRFYQNLFWKNDREDRRDYEVFNGSVSKITDSEILIPEQSIWPLDDVQDYEDISIDTSPSIDGLLFGVGLEDRYIGYAFPLGGFSQNNSSGGAGILLNSYSGFTRGKFIERYNNGNLIFTKPTLRTNWLSTSEEDYPISLNFTASHFYSRLHDLSSYKSVVSPTGIDLHQEISTSTDVETNNGEYWIEGLKTGSLFRGQSAWDAAKLSGKQPFYDNYSLFSEEIKRKGKGYSIIPEFIVSKHVKTLSKSESRIENDLFELSGSMSEFDTSENSEDFYQVLSTTDFLKHFDLVKKDNENFASESILTLKCKAIKKFIAYKDFYPADRADRIGRQFVESYGDFLEASLEGFDAFGINVTDYSDYAKQSFLTAIAAPGILFNTIKSGVAVDYPVIHSSDFITTGDSGEKNESIIFTNYRGQKNLDGNQDPNLINAMLGETSNKQTSCNFGSFFSERIPFEALLEPESYLSNKFFSLQEPHPFGGSEMKIATKWDGGGDGFYKKMIHNFLAEIPEFFIRDQNFSSLSSKEEQDPEFGNAIAGNYYAMRIKMSRTREKPNIMINGFGGERVIPPQDFCDYSSEPDERFIVRENFTMYSRPTAFGPPSYGVDFDLMTFNGIDYSLGPTYGHNYPYTPPYYHGEAWCDVIFKPTVTKKYSLEQIMQECEEYPYYTRHWSSLVNDALRDVTGYQSDSYKKWNKTDGLEEVSLDNAENSNVGCLLNNSKNAFKDKPFSGPYFEYDQSPWRDLLDLRGNTIDSVASYNYGVDKNDLDGYSTKELGWAYQRVNNDYQHAMQHPANVNDNAMQLNSSVNLFGKGTVRKIDIEGDVKNEGIEVASGDTIKGKTRWIIQPKFETPMLNFNKYNNLSDTGCSVPGYGEGQVPRGMWHQYGELPKDDEGVFLQVDDIPKSWFKGALGLDNGLVENRVKSLADLVGFSKDPVRLGEVAQAKEISEAVVAVPFIEKGGKRQFFSIPREDIDSCIGATKREVEPGNFVAGGPPKAGDSVYQMVKKMQKYVFPPSMDFVRYKEVNPFAMYIFEFKHVLSKQDLADIWQNLPPDIGTKMEEAEASISHELLAHELLGGGAVVKNGVLDENAEGNGIPSNIQWMVFKAKKRAKTNYYDKVVAKKGTTEDTSNQQLENAQGQTGDDQEVTYNWPYDFFSLVELVKIDAEVTFANLENDDKGQKVIKKVSKKPYSDQIKDGVKSRGEIVARGKGRPNR